ncbi:hypothetical protein [Luteitalea pratensis]|uniref:hypothetical protein n=1 Tax=Luteitalea pratensis TaxID=1855912 RepID=UPI000D73EF2A|nr:hypothetical protein [Luteitalea pratensis]
MRNLLGRQWRPIARIAAVAWLLVLAPAELAATLARLISAPAGEPGFGPATLIALRVLVTAGGLMLGRRLVSGATGMRPAALAWAVADLGTLVLVLTSGRVPSNRAPGDAPIVWAVYAMAALVVIAASSSTAPPGREP